MPPFRDVEFPDACPGGDGRSIQFYPGKDGRLSVSALRFGKCAGPVSCLTAEQQDELWRRIGEARGHLPPASSTPKPWRDIGGEG
jgi:hypothetical protein